MMSWHMYRPIVVALIHQLASAALGTLLLLVVVVDCCILQPKLHTHPTTHTPPPTQTPPAAAAIAVDEDEASRPKGGELSA